MPDSEKDVANNEDSTTSSRQLGGITGKGFMPGQSGNPSGRPKRKPLTDAYMAILGKTIPPEVARKLDLPESATYAEVIAMSLAREAVKGKVNAAAEMADRVEGKVTQPISGPDEGPIVHEIRGMKAVRDALYGK